jgi:hypothetical protein
MQIQLLKKNSAHDLTGELKMASRNFCSSCGVKLVSGSAFCGNCGSAVSGDVPLSNVLIAGTMKDSKSASSKNAPYSNKDLSKGSNRSPQQPTPAYPNTLFGVKMSQGGEKEPESTIERDWKMASLAENWADPNDLARAKRIP